MGTEIKKYDFRRPKLCAYCGSNKLSFSFGLFAEVGCYDDWKGENCSEGELTQVKCQECSFVFLENPIEHLDCRCLEDKYCNNCDDEAKEEISAMREAYERENSKGENVSSSHVASE